MQLWQKMRANGENNPDAHRMRSVLAACAEITTQ
jgi:hypothetical protein